MRLDIFDTQKAMADAAAAQTVALLRDAIDRQGHAVFVAATGASQFGFLEALTANPEIDWARITMFHLDEFIDLPETHSASFRRYLKERLIDLVHPGKVVLIEGDAPDPQVEVQRLNDQIAGCEVDVTCVGIGENGHLAFNDPPADFDIRAPYTIVDLDDACRRQQWGEGWFSSLEEVPRSAITMTVRQIIKSRVIICVVPDRRKAQAVHDCFTGEVTPQNPASILRQHDRAYVFLDAEAASLLPG